MMMSVGRCPVWVVSDPPCDVRTCAWVASGNSHVLYNALRRILDVLGRRRWWWLWCGKGSNVSSSSRTGGRTCTHPGVDEEGPR